MKKKMGLLAVVLTLVIGVAGCGGSEKSEKDSSKGVKTFKVAVSPDFSPFEFMENDKMTGFDVELVEALAKQMNRKIELQNMAWDGLIPAVSAGNADAAISGISITPERAKSVLFSDPYYRSGLITVVQENNETIQSFDDLKGKRIAVQIGTTGALKAHSIPGATVRDFNMSPDTILELQNGGVDAVVNDLPVILFYLKDKTTSGLKLVGDVEEAEDYGIVVAKENQALAKEINEALKALKANGEYEKIYIKWFGTKPKNV